MNFYYSELFAEKTKQLPPEIKKALRRKLELMASNPHHPSLRAKKIREQDRIFEASITTDIRMTWEYVEDGILLRNIGEHDKTLRRP